MNQNKKMKMDGRNSRRVQRSIVEKLRIQNLRYRPNIQRE